MQQFADPGLETPLESFGVTSDELTLVSYRRVKPARPRPPGHGIWNAPTAPSARRARPVRAAPWPQPERDAQARRGARVVDADQPRTTFEDVAGGEPRTGFRRRGCECRARARTTQPGGTQQIFIAVSAAAPWRGDEFPTRHAGDVEMTITSPVTGARLHLRAVPARVPFGAQS